MTERLWDVEFLAGWEKDEAAERLRVVTKADSAIAAQRAERKISDRVGRYRLCTVSSCRRHRACRTRYDVCTALPPLQQRRISHQRELSAQYAELQKQRRDEAQADADAK
jgi:hypothetical protein